MGGRNCVFQRPGRVGVAPWVGELGTPPLKFVLTVPEDKIDDFVVELADNETLGSDNVVSNGRQLGNDPCSQVNCLVV